MPLNSIYCIANGVYIAPNGTAILRCRSAIILLLLLVHKFLVDLLGKMQGQYFFFFHFVESNIKELLMDLTWKEKIHIVLIIIHNRLYWLILFLRALIHRIQCIQYIQCWWIFIHLNGYDTYRIITLNWWFTCKTFFNFEMWIESPCHIRTFKIYWTIYQDHRLFKNL